MSTQKTYTSLGQMIKDGNYDALKNNLEARDEKKLSELNEIEANGMRSIDALLFFSMKYKNERQLDIMELLIKYGADVNIIDNNGVTILMMACRENNTQAVQAILGSPSVNVNKKDAGAFDMAAHYAVKANAVECFDLLVNVGNIDPKYQCPLSGRNFLHYACYEGHLEMVEKLISLGVDPTVEDAIEQALPAEMIPEGEEFEPIFTSLEAYRETFAKNNNPFAI